MGARGIFAGAVLGSFFGGPLGALIGAFVGHAIEKTYLREMTDARRKAWREYARRAYREQERVRREFAERMRGGSSALERAYSELGVSANDSNDAIKRAYRTLAKRNHPDLLRANGASEGEVARATERMSRLNAAWAKIREVRGL